MPHLPLPDIDPVPPKKTATASKPLPSSLVDHSPVPDRVVWSIGGQFAYLISVSQKNGGFSGVVVMVNPVSITPDRLKEMVSEAAQITNDSCLVNRRKEISRQKVGIADPKALNEKWFKADLEFFETVLMDKFQFQRLHATTASTEIEPTVII